MEGYTLIPWWDLFLHCLSGALAGLIGLILFNALRKNNGKIDHQDMLLAVLFVNFFGTTTAALWEYYEFILDEFFGATAQMVALTGVSDTMTDMMVCTLGTVVVSIIIFLHYTTKYKSMIMQTVDHYYEKNNK